MKIIIGFLCLIFLIIFHELGHFVAAKLFGVKVEAFSVGFGPVLFHKKKGDTDYRFSLIPLGGYCAMKGEKDFQNALEANLSEIVAEPDSMYGVHPFKRVLIAFFGPLFNAFFAFFAFFLISLIGFSYYSYSSKIILADEIYPELHSAAREGGLLSGDIIISINEKKIENFSDIMEIVSINPDKTLKILVNRNDEELVFFVKTDFDKSTGTGKIGVTSDLNTQQKYESKRYSFFPAIVHGITETGKSVLITIKGISLLFKGVDIQNSVSGPARIADMLGEVVTESFSASFKAGIINLLNFLAYISISLFIMNLLPIPILDGGLILFALIEILARKKISPKVLYYIQFLGVAFIAVLFLIGLTGDIKYFINNFKGGIK